MTGGHEHEKREKPVDYEVARYYDRIADEDLTSIDRIIALEALVRKDLNMGDEGIGAYLAGFGGLLDDLYDRPNLTDEEKLCRAEELFAVAPLTVVWGPLRDLKSPLQAQKWLTKAVSEALKWGDAHEDDFCRKHAPGGSDSCFVSDTCIPRTVVNALTHRIRTDSPDVMSAEEIIFGRAFVENSEAMAMTELGVLAEHELLTRLEGMDLLNQRRKRSTLPSREESAD